MRRFILILSTVLGLAVAARAEGDVMSYRNRVSAAVAQIELLREDSHNDQHIAVIKALLPKAETVQMQGQPITVDNAWLHASLDSYMAEKEAEERAKILDDASSRLDALDEHLRESSEAHDANAREKIKEILSRAEYAEKKDDWLTALIKDVRRKVIDFLRDIYTRIFQAIFGVGQETSWVFRVLVFLAIGIALFVIARMLVRFKEGRTRTKKRKVLGEEIEAGVTSNDLMEAAMAAAREGDYRMGVRKLYISLLYELDERNLIELEPNATNHEYLAKASRFSALAAPMRYLTERFDYFWYGMFPSTESDFSAYHASYKAALAEAQMLGEKAAQS